LPDIGTLAAVHFKYTCRRPELNDDRIHVLTDVLVSKSGDNFLLRRSQPLSAAQSATTPRIRIKQSSARGHPSATFGRDQ
jgi:hypothetical protein